MLDRPHTAQLKPLGQMAHTYIERDEDIYKLSLPRSDQLPVF